MPNRKRQRLVERWYDWNHRQPRSPWESDGLQPDTRNMSFYGGLIRNGSGTENLARYITTRNDGVGVVQVALPNALTVGRTREIYAAVHRSGGMAFSVPFSVLRQASIHESSVEVIDIERRPRPLRAPQQLLRATVRAYGAKRKAYFLAGYDLNEPGLSYFFCELPPDAEPTTIEEAYQALKPHSVKVAEAQGKKVRRQGDVFFIRMERDFNPVPDQDLWRERDLSWGAIYRTNHVAEHRHIADDGLYYVKGRIKHDPLGRRPDHRTLHLGNRWWLAVKNTVPVTV